jgi:hypothetical protein
MSDLTQISEDDCLLDFDDGAWRRIVERRGGCRCCISPPCSACTEPPSEEELNREGYTIAEKGGAQ